MIKNILVIGHSNIGDVCYNMCVIDPLTKKFPLAAITFLTSSRCNDIVKGYKGVTKIINLDRHGKDKGVFNRVRFIWNLRKEHFDLVVVLRSSLVYTFAGIPKQWRVTKKMRRQYDHPVDRYLHMLHSYGINRTDAAFHFSSHAEDELFCKEYLASKGINSEDKVIGILPFAAWPLKAWPIEKWNDLAGALKKHGIKFINIAKTSNNDQSRRLAEKLSTQIIDASDTSLAQAKSLLQRCQLFVGPDSSFLHLASCMGIECIGLYGATASRYFYPYFHRHNIVWSKAKLSCMPCYPGAKPGWYCSKDGKQSEHGPCMEGVEIKDVLTVITERLNLS